jgi:pimeloyl-ACP methyl ester carboxylesterase
MHEHYLDFGGAKPLLHLAPANGFPPEAYRPLANNLATHFHVLGYRPRPLWPDAGPPEIDSWDVLADEMLADMGRVADGPLVAVGHSLGGILTLYCALRRPELFRGVALLDPVILPRRLLLLIWAARRVNQHHRSPLARGAARRRHRFAAVDDARARLQGRGAFAGFVNEALDGYLEGGLRPASDGGVTLAWPREWESRIFSLVPMDTWQAVRQLRVPLLLMRGASSDMMIDKSWAALRRLLPKARLEQCEGGHMFPMERPDEVAATISGWAESLRGA